MGFFLLDFGSAMISSRFVFLELAVLAVSANF